MSGEQPPFTVPAVDTLIESYRRRGLDPYTCLREVLTRLPRMTNRQIPEIIPGSPATTPPSALCRAEGMRLAA
jgi:hypothetical protein